MEYRDECEAQVKGFHGAKYKKFYQQDEAEAFASLAAHSSPTKQPSSTTKVSPSRCSTDKNPYKRPEPVSNDLPIIPSVVPTTPSKQPDKAKGKPPLPTISSPSNDTKWRQRESSPNVEDESTWDVAYSDGACKGNGQPGSVAGIGVWWGRDDPRCA
jgi:ribonuclease HI